MIRVRRPLDGAGGPSYLPSRGHPHGPTPPPSVPEVGAEVRRRVPTQAPTGRTRPRAQGPKTNQRPTALTAVRALRRRYVGAGSNIKTKAGPTSEGRPVRTRQNRNVAPPDPPPAAPTQPIRCRARSHHTAAAHHWPLPRAPHHAVREVDTKAANAESIDSHRICSNPAFCCKGGSQRSKFCRKICDKSWDSAGLTVYRGVIEQDLRYSSFYRDRLGENSL